MSPIIKPGDRAFYINKRRYKELATKTVIGVEGFYSGVAIKPGIGVVRSFGSKVPTPNLLTDLAMDAFGTGPQFSQMHLGTGTTPPAVTDTSLADFGVSLPSVNTARGNSGSEPYYGWVRFTSTSAVGAATGNWTEIGMSNQNSNGGLRSRALILDSDGNPTVFTVLEDEQFQGTYEFRVYVPSVDSPATVNISGVAHDTITRALHASSGEQGHWAPGLGLSPLISGRSSSSAFFTGGLSAMTGSSPLGASTGDYATTTTLPYGSGNFYIDATARWGAGSVISAGATLGFRVNGAPVQVNYSPAINKSANEELIVNQRFYWARR